MIDLDVKTLSGLTQDSRAVKPGYLFAAFPGEKHDGRDYIEAAIKAGASAILAPEGTEIQGDVTLLTDENPRKAFAHIVADFYAAQPETIAAVTGTNGKTSIVSFLEQLWNVANFKSASLGTLSGKMTTLDPVSLHEELAAKTKAGITHLAMEASSHGLDQYRLDGARVQVAGFTNLSRDHLDYHEDMDSYLAAKKRLFSEVLECGGTAVLNADVPEFEALKTSCESRNIRVIDYGYKAHDITLLSAKPLAHGQNLNIQLFGQEHAITLPLVGDFQAMNALCALGMALAGDMEDEELFLEAIQNLEGAPGRLQSITGHPEEAGIYVDYAHTPDALETVLKALRSHTKGRLVCLFGCGGDRDKGKRPLMGKAAAELADVVIVTDDNPRSEDPATIRTEILKATPSAEEIGDRRSAIREAVAELKSGDVLLIAGKGHEQGQIFADRTEDFDDAQEVRSAIEYLTNPNMKKEDD